MGQHAVRIEVESVSNGFRVHQKRYLEMIAMMKKKGSFSEFRSLRAHLAWATLSRRDISCAVAQSAQVNEDLVKTGFESHVKKLNRFVTHLKRTMNQVLMFTKLELETLSLRM
jgi:hypothetical protein